MNDVNEAPTDIMLNKLDIDEVTQIVFFDATGLLDNIDADNTLWINGLKVSK